MAGSATRTPRHGGPTEVVGKAGGKRRPKRPTATDLPESRAGGAKGSLRLVIATIDRAGCTRIQAGFGASPA